MNPLLLQKLKELNLLSDAQMETIQIQQSKDLFSLRTEILFLFSAGVILAATGAGILIYQNIGSIGHVLFLSALFCASLACFYTCCRSAPGFRREKTESAGPLADYLLLLGNLLAGSFVSYLQFKYEIFGEHHDLATLLPTLLYFWAAYYFDHKGVLVLAISGLCATVGFSVSARDLLFDQHGMVLGWSALFTAFGLTLGGILLEHKNIKSHFFEMYQSFGLHIFAVAAIKLSHDHAWMYVVLFAGLFYSYKVSFRLQSQQLLTFTLLYAFIGLGACILHFFEPHMNFDTMLYLSPFYIAFFIWFFLGATKQLKKLKHDAGIQ